jgi:GT2 family glycosyltransferase
MQDSEPDSSANRDAPIKPGSVGIVVLNYKKAALTIACIHSLKIQTYSDFEILLVDNASNDLSADIFRSEFPDLRLIESAFNLGYAGGNNLGIRRFLNEGKEFIWVLNNDTIVPPQTLQWMVHGLQSHPEWGMAGSHIKDIKDPNVTIQLAGGRVSVWSGLNNPIVNPIKLPDLNYLTGSSLLIRNHALKSVGIFDEGYFHYWEDVDLSFRMERGNWKLGHVLNAIVYHHEGASLATASSTAAFYYSRGIVRFFLKNSSTKIIPIFISTLLRLVKALFYLRFTTMMSVLRGAWQGIRYYPKNYYAR